MHSINCKKLTSHVYVAHDFYVRNKKRNSSKMYQIRRENFFLINDKEAQSIKGCTQSTSSTLCENTPIESTKKKKQTTNSSQFSFHFHLIWMDLSVKLQRQVGNCIEKNMKITLINFEIHFSFPFTSLILSSPTKNYTSL